jgi:two-component system, cell cycle sensor histidine kinase and response regulator CckA
LAGRSEERIPPGGPAAPVKDDAGAVEAVLDAVLDASPAGIVVLDATGRIKTWNEGARRTFGWTDEEVLARSLAEVLGPGAAGARVLGGDPEEARSLPFEASHKDGHTVNLLASWVTLRGAGGALTGVVLVLQEVTGSREIEQRFLDAQRLEVVDRIAGAIAHDLKNVLSAIKGFAIVAAEGLPGDDQARGDMDQILKAAERGAALAQKLLAFSRNPVVQPAVLDLNVVLQSVDKTVRRLLGNRLEIAIRHGADVGCIKADASQVEQVVVNLVLNARDAMPSGGRLMIETANLEVGDAEAGATGLPPGRYARLLVIDNGRGMPPETRARMFEPFFTTKEPERALGLGLAATRNIVRQLGGNISASSEPGKGTTITVDLPVTSELTPGAGGPRAARREGAEGGGGETILVVEDDDLVRMLTVKVLRRRGYTVIEASSPLEAIDLVAAREESREAPIDLLLSDVGLPHVGGPELARQLTAARPHLKVLFMSGYGRGALAERGLTAGHGVLEKPFSPDALLARIRAVLGAPAAAP